MRTIRLAVEGPLARVTLDRPEVLNAGNAEWVRDLAEAVARIEGAREVRVVVLTGAGRAFSSGVDLDALASGAFGLADFERELDAIVRRLLALPAASVRAGKVLAARAFELSFDAFRREMQAHFKVCLDSDEHRRAMDEIRTRRHAQKGAPS